MPPFLLLLLLSYPIGLLLFIGGSPEARESYRKEGFRGLLFSYESSFEFWVVPPLFALVLALILLTIGGAFVGDYLVINRLLAIFSSLAVLALIRGFLGLHREYILYGKRPEKRQIRPQTLNSLVMFGILFGVFFLVALLYLWVSGA